MNLRPFFVIGLILAGVFLLSVFALSEGPREKGERETALLRIGEATITAEVADTAAKRAQGLSGRESLGAYEGMLFVFPEAGYHAFWMKNMRFPIDIVWIGEDMRVVGVTENVSPDTFPEAFYPPAPTRYVLETNPRATMPSIGKKIETVR